MTLETNAAISAAFEAGATRVLVNDSHGSMNNLLLDELDPRAEVIRGWLKPLGMMQGIEQGWDAAFFVGYHAQAGDGEGVLAHTINGANFHTVRLNGSTRTPMWPRWPPSFPRSSGWTGARSPSPAPRWSGR